MDTVIEVTHVKKALKGQEILKDISFQVEKGDIFGFLGPNGAGKTTTIRILLGLYQADHGKVSVLGKQPEEAGARESIGFLLDGDGLYDNMTPMENLDFYLHLYGKSGDRAEIQRVLGLVGMAGKARSKVGTFSKGMRQKVGLAKALVHNPEVIILDEPTSGLDPSAQIEFRNLVEDIVRKERKTVFLSSHNLEEVQRICNRIAILNQGEIKRYGELQELRRQMGNDTVTVQMKTGVSDDVFGQLCSNQRLGVTGRNGRSLVLQPETPLRLAELVEQMTGMGIEVEEVTKNEASMEELYASIIREV